MDIANELELAHSSLKSLMQILAGAHFLRNNIWVHPAQTGLPYETLA